MNVLITGGAGFIASFVAERLLARGCRVTLLDNLDPQVHPQGPPSYLPATARLVVGDVRDGHALTSLLAGVDAVVHCAAAVGVAQSLYRIGHFTDVNVAGTGLLLEKLAECKPRPPRLVVLVSNTQYGEGLYRRPSDGALVRPPIRTESDIARHGFEPACPTTGEPLTPVPTPEDAALLARNVYALTKWWQEELALAVGATYDFPVVCLRLFNVYGPRQSLANPYTGVLAIFLSRLLAGKPPAVYEDGLQSRDFVSVHDVARAVELALGSEAARGRVVNVASGRGRTILACAEDLADKLRLDLSPLVTGSFRSGDIRHCTADITLAGELLGYRPEVSWQDGLDELVAWSRSAATEDGFDAAQAELAARGLVRSAPTSRE